MILSEKLSKVDPQGGRYSIEKKTSGGDIFPEDPKEWNLTTLSRDSQNIHKLFEDVAWSCPECGNPGEPVNPAFLASFPNLICDDCYSSTKTAKVEARKIEEAEERGQVIPEIYQETDPNHPGLNYRARSEIMSWNLHKGKGLWVVGDTRTGKTRCVCLLVQELIKKGHKVRAFFHGSFGDELLEVIKSDKSFRVWKSKIMQAPVLFIDDLFASKMTDRTEATLFDILDARITYRKPTLVTTQLTGKEARSFFHSEQRLRAFFARVQEFFQVVTIEKETQTIIPSLGATK